MRQQHLQRTTDVVQRLCALGVQVAEEQPLRGPELSAALEQQQRRSICTHGPAASTASTASTASATPAASAACAASAASAISASSSDSASATPRAQPPPQRRRQLAMRRCEREVARTW